MGTLTTQECVCISHHLQFYRPSGPTHLEMGQTFEPRCSLLFIAGSELDAPKLDLHFFGHVPLPRFYWRVYSLSFLDPGRSLAANPLIKAP